MENDIKTTPITIGSHTVQEFADNKLHKIVDADGKTKYQFYEQRKAGGTSKAWQQWQDFELKPGIKVTAGVSETPKTFRNAEGKEIAYKQRTIVYFEGDEHGTPHMQDVPVGFQLTEKMWDDLNNRVTELEMDKFPGVKKDEIDASDLPF